MQKNRNNFLDGPERFVRHCAGVFLSGHEAMQRRHRHFIHNQNVKNGSIDSRQFPDDVVVDTSLHFCDDDSTCDLGNIECDNAFDLEPAFPSYQAM